MEILGVFDMRDKESKTRKEKAKKKNEVGNKLSQQNNKDTGLKKRMIMIIDNIGIILKKHIMLKPYN